MEDSGTVYYFPPIREFKDTGFVTHGFNDGAMVTARVVKSNDSGGFAINIILRDQGGKEVCNVVLDRFAALCLSDCIIKNLLNQEELIDNEYERRSFTRRRTGEESSGMGERKGD